MTTITSKYRGTTAYFRLYAELITAARYRGTLTYPEVAEIMGITPMGSHMASQTGIILGEISEDEHNNGRPTLSAIAVSSTNGEVGPGFFWMAEQLGKLSSDASDEEKRRYWEAERGAVYATWRRQPKTTK